MWKWILPLFLWSCCIVQAAGGEDVQITNERKIPYPANWGIYGTHYYSALSEEGKSVAYCVEPAKSQILTGQYTAKPMEVKNGMREALYYGYGGPGQGEYLDKQQYGGIWNCSAEDAKYVFTHLAASYFYDPVGAFYSMDMNNIRNSGVWDYIEWLETKDVPSVTSTFSETSLFAEYEKSTGLQRTKSIQYLSESAENQITIECPSGVTLHNESTGSTGTGKVVVKANEKFYFSAALDIAESIGQVWESGPLIGEKDKYWDAMIIPSFEGRQVSGYGCYNRESITPAKFKVRWVVLGSVEIQKVDKDTGEAKPQESRSFQGAVYSVSKGNEEYGRIETDKNGYGKLENVPAGVYTVKEIKAPFGYELDPEIHTAAIKFEGDEKTAVVTSKEEVIKVKLNIQKTEDEAGGNSSQSGSLKGAEYTVYAGEDIGTLKKDEEAGKIITDETGKGSLENLLPGKYYVKETKAPPYYFLDKTKYEVTFPLDGSKKEETITSKEKPVKGKIKIKKTDKNTKENAGAGFQFSVTAGEDIKSDDGVVRIKKGELVETITTGENGLAETKAMYPGCYIVKEEIAGEYYANEGKSYEVFLKDDTQEAIEVSLHIENEKTKIEIRKADEEETDKKLENAEFRLYSEEELTPEQIENLGEMPPEAGRVLVTNKDGICAVKDLLHNMKYYMVEIKAPEGYVRDKAVHEFYVDEKGLIEQKPEYVLELTNKAVKVEISKKGEDGKEELPGAELALYGKDGQKVETWVTETKPHQMKCLKEGVYTLKEEKAPTGYQKAEDLVIEVKSTSALQKFEMTDRFLKGKITILKKDSETKQNLGKDFQFVIKAAADIVLPYGKILYKTGDEVENICTDENGIAVSSELFPGLYEIQEVQSGEYYAADGRIYEAELLITKENKIKNKEIEIENTKTYLEIEKTDAETGEPMENIVFTISRAEDWEEEQKPDKEIIEKTGVKIATDKEGKAKLVELKHGSTYYLAETSTKEGYLLDENIYSFQVDEQGLINGKEKIILKISNQPEEPKPEKPKPEKPKPEEPKPEKPQPKVPKEERGKTVKTGDGNNLIGWLILSVWSAGCLAVLAKRRKR